MVARADQNAVTRLNAVMLDQCVRQPVRPIGQFLVRPTASVADQCNAVAEALLHQAIGQLDGCVQALGILEFRAIEQNVRPFIEGWQVVARECVDMRGWTELWDLTCWSHVKAPPFPKEPNGQ